MREEHLRIQGPERRREKRGRTGWRVSERVRGCHESVCAMRGSVGARWERAKGEMGREGGTEREDSKSGPSEETKAGTGRQYLPKTHTLDG